MEIGDAPDAHTIPVCLTMTQSDNTQTHKGLAVEAAVKASRLRSTHL
jgi:hypothetical protein